MEQYFKFDGGATRSEHWAVYLIALHIGIVVFLSGAVISGVFGILLMLFSYFLAQFVMTATAVRRARSAGINPWWGAATLFPIGGSIVYIVIGILNTDEGTN